MTEPNRPNLVRRSVRRYLPPSSEHSPVVSKISHSVFESHSNKPEIRFSRSATSLALGQDGESLARSRISVALRPAAKRSISTLIPTTKQCCPCHPGQREIGYNATTDARRVVIGGASLGGLAATCAALNHSETFGNVLSQSGSYWWVPKPSKPSESDPMPSQIGLPSKLSTARSCPFGFT